MNKICIITITFLITILSGCKEEESNIQLFPEELCQTTWNVTETMYDKNENILFEESYIIQFITTNKGLQITKNDSGEYDEKRNLWYNVEGKIITFNGALVGYWTIIEKSKNRIMLEAYLPRKYVMVLEKLY